MSPLLWIIAVVVAWVVLLGWIRLVGPMMAATRRRNEESALERAPTRDLLARAQSAVRYEGWERFESGARLLSLATCTDEELHACLTSLFAEVADEDQREGRSGRDSNYFEMYDCGLVLIIEALDARLSRSAKPDGE